MPSPTSTLYFIYYTIICLYIIILDSDLSTVLYVQTVSKSVHIAKTPIFSNLNYLNILSFGLGKYNLVLLIPIENAATKPIFLSLSFSPHYFSLLIPLLAQPTLSCRSLPSCLYFERPDSWSSPYLPFPFTAEV